MLRTFECSAKYEINKLTTWTYSFRTFFSWVQIWIRIIGRSGSGIKKNPDPNHWLKIWVNRSNLLVPVYNGLLGVLNTVLVNIPIFLKINSLPRFVFIVFSPLRKCNRHIEAPWRRVNKFYFRPDPWVNFNSGRYLPSYKKRVFLYFHNVHLYFRVFKQLPLKSYSGKCFEKD